VSTATRGLTTRTYEEVMMASTSVGGGSPVNKPYVDRKLSTILSATLTGKRSGTWYVYLAFDRRQYLRYVGQTGTLLSRLSQHRANGRLGDAAYQQGGDWADMVAVSCRGDVQVKALERKLIHGFHPPDNRKCEMPGCRYYLDGLPSILASRAAVNKNLRGRGIEVR
jgi:hypothetical protein